MKVFDSVQNRKKPLKEYKIIDTNFGPIIENPSLRPSFDIENMDVGVNIRWVVDQLKNDETITERSATWVVYLGYNDGDTTSVYKGETNGKISKPKGEGFGFGFDPIFIPRGSQHTLAELEEMNKNDDYSARYKAVKNFLSNNKVKEIKNWAGDYQ